MVFKNEKFEKDVEEFISLARCLLGVHGTNEIIRTTDVSNESYDTDDYHRLLSLWNNTVTGYPLEINHLQRVIVSERFNTAAFIIKKEEFIYGSAIPYGIFSLSGSQLFAIPDTADNSALIRIFKMLNAISKDIISSMVENISINDGIADSMANILTSFTLYKMGTFRSKLSRVLTINNIVRISSQLSKLGKGFGIVTDNILNQYSEYSIIGVMRSLFYENRFMNYLATVEQNVSTVKESESPAELTNPISETDQLPTSNEEDIDVFKDTKIEIPLSDPNVPNLRMFA